MLRGAVSTRHDECETPNYSERMMNVPEHPLCRAVRHGRTQDRLRRITNQDVEGLTLGRH